MYACIRVCITYTDGCHVSRYVMHCCGIALAGTPGKDMLYFDTLAVLKSPEHLWVHVTDRHMNASRDGVLLT